MSRSNSSRTPYLRALLVHVRAAVRHIGDAPLEPAVLLLELDPPALQVIRAVRTVSRTGRPGQVGCPD